MSTPNPYQTQYQPPAPKPKHWVRQHWLALLLVALVAGGIGFGAGVDDTQQASDTIASQADEADPETKTVTEEVTPQDCLDALDAANQLRGDAADVARLSVRMSTINQQWPGLVLDAANAGATLDAAALDDITETIDGMTVDTKQVNRKLDKVNDRVTSHVYEYEHAAAGCRSAS